MFEYERWLSETAYIAGYRIYGWACNPRRAIVHRLRWLRMRNWLMRVARIANELDEDNRVLTIMEALYRSHTGFQRSSLEALRCYTESHSVEMRRALPFSIHCVLPTQRPIASACEWEACNKVQ